MSGKTIQIFLPDGNPRGVKVADITSRTVQVMFIPRAELDLAAKRQELSGVGVYFLIGETEDSGVKQVYVGEAEDCLARLKQHNKQKDFWSTALVGLSKTQYFTKSHVKYLEWHCHDAINAAGRFKLENSGVPTKSFVSESMEADLLDNFETLKVLVSTLGYPLFDQIKKSGKQSILYCRGKDADARGEYTEDGLVVFSGSVVNLRETQSASSSLVNHRRSLVESGVLVSKDGKTYQFSRDYVFASPSMASSVVLARSSNGWNEWKYADGRTLDEVHRQQK